MKFHRIGIKDILARRCSLFLNLCLFCRCFRLNFFCTFITRPCLTCINFSIFCQMTFSCRMVDRNTRLFVVHKYMITDTVAIIFY